MRLSSLIASNDGLTLHGADIDIRGLTVNSRDVKPGYLFIAIPGTKHDGREYIEAAILNGATAILIPDSDRSHHLPPTQPPPQGGRSTRGNTDGVLPPLRGELEGGVVTYITAPDVRRATSALAAKFYPRQPEMIAAITGTSGKTSTAQFVRELWQQLGHKSASIGTLGLVTADSKQYGSLTTPETTELYRLLDQCAGQGVTHLAMEASSHGLALHRLDDVHVKVGGFTNLSRDHLDYHETMENYFAAKLRLFTEVMPSGATAVLNADSAEFDKLSKAAKAHGLKIISYGRKGMDIKLTTHEPEATGQRLRFELSGKKQDIMLPVMGDFQAWNALCALGIVIASGAREDKAVAALSKISGVPGRLQLAGRNKKGGAVFIDYAHKPDALENVLNAMRPHAEQHQGKLGLVFGCGGNRDKGKRPLMGQIASKLADWSIVTDDNPRNENPATIRKEILAAGKPGPNFIEIGDRAEAIAAAIGRLGKNDVLIVAGKGHESGQIIGDKVIPFDDADVVRKNLT